MGFSGELKRVPAARLQELLAHPDEIVSELYPPDDPPDRSAWFSIEKAFDGIRFLLHRATPTAPLPAVDAVPWFAPMPESSATPAILDYGPVCYRTPEQVAHLAPALARLTRDEVRRAFDPRMMMEKGVYPQTWDRGDEEFEYLWVHLQALRDFYQDAARRGEGMLLWLA